MIDYSYLRPAKRPALKKWHDSFCKKTELLCQKYENAVILPLREGGSLLFGLGGVVSEGEYVETSGIPGRVGGFYDYAYAERNEDTVVYCGFLPNHWGHFLIEGTARLWYALEADETVDKYVFIVKEGEEYSPRGNYREFFELLGIIDKIEFVNKPVEFKKIIVPALGYSRLDYYSDKYVDIYNRLIDSALKKTQLKEFNSKVFLSRSCFAKAKLTEVGLDMLDSFFRNNGYRIIYPETVSLTDLICYMHFADICAAESGSLSHNFLFAPHGAECIIIERYAIANEIQANIDIIKHLNVTYVDGNYQIYPVESGGGPFFLAYEECFRSFADHNELLPPDQYYLSDRYMFRCIKRYLRMYKKTYLHTWGLVPWMLEQKESLWEAYSEAKDDMGEYLNGARPLFFSERFRFRYLKIKLKNVLTRMKSLSER